MNALEHIVEDPDEAAWDAAVALHEEAVALWQAGREREALPLAEAALGALSEAVGPGHPDTANAHDTLAEIHARLGNPGLALEHLRRACAILEPFGDLPEVAPMRMKARGGLAYWLAVAGDYAAAEALARATLADAEAHGALDVVYEMLNTLGVVLRFEGRFDEAGEAYAAARAACEQAGRTVPATLLHNLSGLASARDRFLEAEAFAREAIAIRRVAEDEAIGLGMDLAGLADALAGQARHAEAEGTYREALAIYARVAPDHPEVAYALHNLADLYATMGRSADAEAAYRDALARKEAAFGAEHHEIAASLANLAALLAETGRRREALDLVTRALAMAEKLLAPHHPVRVGCQALAADLAR